MLPDLEHLIRLQRLETSASEARARIDAIPIEQEALEQRISASKDAVESAKQRLSEHRAERAAVEKEVAEIESRLNRYKDQLMAVKTNKEYHAIQSEIQGAERDIQAKEDRLLERMMEADDLGERLAESERLHADEEKSVTEERAVLGEELAALEQKLTGFDAQRGEVTGHISAPARDLFETLAGKKKGVAVVEARQGLCTSCRVRLRPQLSNQLRANATLIQCESCQRILYFAESRHMTPATPETPAPPDV